MTRTVSASRVAQLVAGFDRHPAYAGLAAGLRVAIGDGRIPHDTRLPSERELTAALSVSRTTVTRAYAELREQGYAVARQGAGTFTRIPGGRARTLDRALSPRAESEATIDLNCAASSAPPGVAAAYAAAVAALPAYLSGHGYFPAGLPELQAAIARSYDARGLPTEPDQIMVTAGALAAGAVAAHTLVRPGDRVLVESPVYPNAPRAFARAGGRLVPAPVDDAGWDIDQLTTTIGRARPRAAYFIPDFQNPTGHLMSDADRAVAARALAESGTVVVVDECLQQLRLDSTEEPRPLAAHVTEAGGTALTVGGASKAFWGGLRIGWLRAPTDWLAPLTEARLTLDLGAPVVEQLALLSMLDHADDTLAHQRDRLRGQRDTLAAALTAALPDWRFRLPQGGLALWCELPAPLAVPLAEEAERRGVLVSPGPVFAPEGGFASRVRIPFTRPEAELHQAVEALADAWPAALTHDPGDRGRRRAMVA